MDDNDRNDDLLEQAKTVIPTPWISQQHDVYTLYKDKIISELDFLWDIIKKQKIDVYTIGITGTDWKSTVTWVIAQALMKLIPDYKIHITGNFDDAMSKTILDILKSDKKEKNIFVTECSSFMLYPTKQFHFNVSIRTNFATDHLNWHPNMDEYFNAKQNIVKLSNHTYMTEDIYKIIKKDLQEKTSIYPTDYNLKETHFVWKHNEKNLAVAFQVIRKACNEIYWENKVSDEQIYSALNTIYPLEHRLQPIRTLDDIIRYDDGKSTSAQSLQAALEAFKEPIIVICWWSDKGDHFKHLKNSFSNTAYGVFLWQTATQFAQLFDEREKPYNIETTMQDCVEEAYKRAKEHNAKIVLFSPGCASFDMFKDYKDRATQFIAAVESLKE